MPKLFKIKENFDTQLQTAQMSAGQQIDLRIDTKFADLGATVRGIIKDTVKNQYIKKESFAEDESFSGKEPFQSGKQSYVAWFSTVKTFLKKIKNARTNRPEKPNNFNSKPEKEKTGAKILSSRCTFVTHIFQKLKI